LVVSPSSVVEATASDLNREDAKNAKKFKKSLRPSRLCGEKIFILLNNTSEGDYQKFEPRKTRNQRKAQKS
jgi:hypothetical protein